MTNYAITRLDIQGLLNGLDTPEKQAQIQATAVTVGAHSLVESIKAALLREVPKANQKNPKYTDTLLDAVRFSKFRKSDQTRLVHTLGTMATGSGTYRTRFFVNTTKKRYQKTINGKKLKKKRYVGYITGTNFFLKGYNAGKSEAIERMKNAILNIVKNS